MNNEEIQELVRQTVRETIQQNKEEIQGQVNRAVRETIYGIFEMNPERVEPLRENTTRLAYQIDRLEHYVLGLSGWIDPPDCQYDSAAVNAITEKLDKLLKNNPET